MRRRYLCLIFILALLMTSCSSKTKDKPSMNEVTPIEDSEDNIDLDETQNPEDVSYDFEEDFTPDFEAPDPSTNEIPVQKVLVLNLDPTLHTQGGIKLHELHEDWNDPRDLADEFISDMSEVSGGFLNYEIVDWIDIDSFGIGESGFECAEEDYLNTFFEALNDERGYWASPLWPEHECYLDYMYYVEEYDVIPKIQSGELNEVWIFTGVFVGVDIYESLMIGEGAYWCNSPEIQLEGVRPFVIYTFNYERDTDCMLENAGHRMECTLEYAFDGWDHTKPLEEMNKWERFSLYDKVSPGNAACGTVHYAPNSPADYEWGDETLVETTYVDWYDYPNLTGEKVVANAEAWGNGDMRAHHKWWFNLIPKVEGVDEDGHLNNWWYYFVYPTVYENMGY